MSTQYVVFQRHESGYWIELSDRPMARSARSAINSVLTNPKYDSFAETEYAAVPERSFRPVTVKVETKTALKFS